MAAKLKHQPAPDEVAVWEPRVQDRRKWTASHGEMIAGRSYLDEADATAAEMEAKWGADRLRLLVGPELREKFDRQRYKLNHAVWHGGLEEVRAESGRMVKGWLALDRAAAAAGKAPCDPRVWEIALPDGTVAAIVPDIADARRIHGEGRRVSVYTLDEIAVMLDRHRDLNLVKVEFPGATVTAVRRSVGDPLDGVADTRDDIDWGRGDDIPF